MHATSRDFHEEQVRGLVTQHGPADALEPGRAAAMATEVFLHSIIKCRNRQAATGTTAIHLGSPFLCELAPMFVPVLDAIVHRWVSSAVETGALIADLWFERRGRTEYLDTFDIPGLVGTAYGAALGLVGVDGALAVRLVMNVEATAIVDRYTGIR